jgi:hypothetical protein
MSNPWLNRTTSNEPALGMRSGYGASNSFAPIAGGISHEAARSDVARDDRKEPNYPRFHLEMILLKGMRSPIRDAAG